MNIVVIGGRLAALWRKAGHEVTAVGRDGGDASGADVVVAAVPGPVISAALGQVTGLAGKIAIDKARAVQDLTWLPVAALNDAVPVFYRFAVPDEL